MARLNSGECDQTNGFENGTASEISSSVAINFSVHLVVGLVFSLLLLQRPTSPRSLPGANTGFVAHNGSMVSTPKARENQKVRV